MNEQEQRWREEFPITRELIYLNNYSLTPLPGSGRERLERFARERLASLGHVVRDLPDFTPAAAGMCAIRRLEPGTLEGGADPRRESYAIGW